MEVVLKCSVLISDSEKDFEGLLSVCTLPVLERLSPESKSLHLMNRLLQATGVRDQKVAFVFNKINALGYNVCIVKKEHGNSLMHVTIFYTFFCLAVLYFARKPNAD